VDPNGKEKNLQMDRKTTEWMTTKFNKNTTCCIFVEFYKYPMLSYVIPCDSNMLSSLHQTKGRWFLISSGDQGRLR